MEISILCMFLPLFRNTREKKLFFLRFNCVKLATNVKFYRQILPVKCANGLDSRFYVAVINNWNEL